MLGRPLRRSLPHHWVLQVCFSLLYPHLLQLVNNPLCRPFRRDVERVNKQGDRAAAHTLSGEVLEYHLEELPERRALALYLFIAGWTSLKDALQVCACLTEVIDKDHSDKGV